MDDIVLAVRSATILSPSAKCHHTENHSMNTEDYITCRNRAEVAEQYK